ncbi:hypothetical protein [Gordonia alkaliphila]|uniref:hypothetical protein n=1 Tax=Gordonia alkaliphila TaxID=1053547 RepID=UPI0031EFEF75
MNPPVVPVLVEHAAEVDLVIPLEGIGRNAILTAYFRSMPKPMPDRKIVKEHLLSWAGKLGAAKWFRDEYPRTGTILRDRNVRVQEPQTAQVIELCAEYIDPLARYSAGWVNSLAALKPSGLRRDVSNALRDASRLAAGAVRTAMANPPSVQASAASLTSFLEDQSGRHEADEQTALNAYVTKLVSVLGDGHGYGVTLSPEESEAVAKHRDMLTELGARDTAVDEATLRKLRSEIKKALEAVVESDARLQRHPDVGIAFESILTTCVNHRLNGRAVRAIRPSDFLRRIKGRGVSALKMREGELPDEERVAGPSLGVPGEPGAAQIVGLGDLLALAIADLDSDEELRLGDALCWEAEFVRSELLAELGGEHHGDVGRKLFRVRTREAWTAEQPKNSRNRAAAAAVIDCEALMRGLIARAQRRLLEEQEGGEL